MIPELPGYLTKLGGAEYKGLIIALFTLMAGISRPFSGKLTDTVGRVPVMIFGSLTCVVCSLLYPVLSTVTGFLLLRFFHGFSTGFKPTATSAYGADVVHESRRGEALGALAIGYTTGSSVGPIVGSYVVNHFSFHAMFVVSACFALGSVVILYNIRETLPHPQKFTWKILRIRKHEIFDWSAIRPAIIMVLMSVSLGTVLTISPDLSNAVGLANKGLFFTFYTVSSLGIRILAGKSSDRYGRIIVLVISSAILVISMVLLSFAHTPFWILFSSAIFGLSLGMNGPTLMAWTVDLCSALNRGKAVASVYIALEIGIGSGALLSAWIYGNKTENFFYAFLLPAFLGLLAFSLLLYWRKTTQRSNLYKQPSLS